MTGINEFNISEEELAEIEEITELAQSCTEYFLGSLINSKTGENIEIDEETKKSIFKLVLNKTMEYIEENTFPSNEYDFEKYVDSAMSYMKENL